MRQILIAALIFIIASACGSGPRTETPGEMYADVLVRKDVNPPRLDITFYSKIRREDNRMEYTRNVLAVDEPRWNGEALAVLSAEPGAATYQTSTANVAKMNSVTAKVNGKQFEGKTTIELPQDNKMTTVTMAPK